MIKFGLIVLCICFSSSASAQILDIESIAQYEQEVKDSSKQVFVQFTASWCSPCRWVQSEENEWNNRLDERVKIVRVDIQKFPELSRRFNVVSVPHLNMVNARGETLLTKVGTKAIVDLLSKYENSIKDSESFCVQEFVSQAK